MEFPNELKYSEEHIWVDVKDDIATIGITEYASRELDNILFVDLPQVGDMVELGESFGTIESSKTVTDVYAPVSGEVVEVNADIEDDSGIINEYPYSDGWLIKVELSDTDELDSLLDSTSYQAYIEEESEEDIEEESEEDDDDDDDYE